MKLDNTQKQVIEAKENHIIVVAGAGSGKTAFLTELIKYLLDSGIEPEGIVAITFTNMAAEEMKERLRDVKGIGDAFIGTIHSFANKILRNKGEYYAIYSSELDISYHQYLIDRYGKYLSIERYIQYSKMLVDFELGKIDEYDLNNFLDTGERIELKVFNRTKDEIDYYRKNGGTHYLESIDTLCKKNNVITFDELIIKAEEYFRSLGIRLNHLLVDEFQDIGNLEYSFIRSLNAENTFFIGDDYQSIYGFKGSNVNIFKSLVTNNKYKAYFLKNNYRNSKSIIDIANRVINQVPDRIDKKVYSMNKNTGSVSIYKQHLFVETCLERLIKEQNFKDWFILVRTNKDLNKIVSMCDKMNIPHSTFRREGMTLEKLHQEMDNDTVKILTVHGAKGLENKKVALYGNFPINVPKYMREYEERRVMYVGITRAIDELIIYN